MNMKYIIVGAGISGLSIGQVLKEYGHDVQLFEADSCPGGMVNVIECMDICFIALEDMSLTQNVRMYWIGFGVILTKRRVYYGRSKFSCFNG